MMNKRVLSWLLESNTHFAVTLIVYYLISLAAAGLFFVIYMLYGLIQIIIALAILAPAIFVGNNGVAKIALSGIYLRRPM
jgi:hypothetical protein